MMQTIKMGYWFGSEGWNTKMVSNMAAILKQSST